jgi:glycyl-tRNA synthetase beta chain
LSLDFLLEIGTEEIPHWMIPGALVQLDRWARRELPMATVNVDATPRRLVIRASGVPANEGFKEEPVWGPVKSAPAVAIEGFAKKHGISVNELQVQQKEKGEYFVYIKRTELSYLKMLEQHLPSAIFGIDWPKTMFWTSNENEAFIRPIRWIVALLGDRVIDFTVAGVKSGNVTRGHRILGASSIPVTIATYESELRKNFVILAAHERRHKIEKEAAALGAKLDGDLVETLTYITEFPTAIRGDFDPAYLALPREVLTMVMRFHQKYFSVEDGGELAPHFVAVMNTSGDPEGLVKHGNERVLKARFNDARFFWDVDQVRKLSDRVEDLAKVTFQAKLGSYKDKTDRIVALVKELSGDTNAQRAALLCKCDLTTEMVKEFSDLQGLIGGLYAGRQGEPEQVWYAIYQHYRPINMEDEVPETTEGQILSLADRLDTLRSCFSVGMIPSGSKDPFALRRTAQGVVKILVQAQLDFQFDQLFQGELRGFMLERVQHYFREVRGFKYDEVNAVLKVGVSTLKDVEDRLNHIARVRPTPNFEPLAASFKRINNILKQANFTQGVVRAEMLEGGPERELYEAYERLPAAGPLEDVAELRPRVDLFFDKVMVNAPDPKIRENRLSMLSDMLRKFSTIADFSEIVTSGDQTKS